jgi:hypothetical protein
MGFKKFVLLLLILSLITYLWYYTDKQEKESAEIFLRKDNVSFTGRITSYSRSTNQSYGVVRFKVIKSNRETFNISDPRLLYPYRLKKGYGEFRDPWNNLNNHYTPVVDGIS